MDASDENNVYLYDAASSEWVLYEVDAVWGYDHSQAEVFADVEPLVGSVAEGKSSCIIAYGDAHAGKPPLLVAVSKLFCTYSHYYC